MRKLYLAVAALACAAVAATPAQALVGCYAHQQLQGTVYEVYPDTSQFALRTTGFDILIPLVTVTKRTAITVNGAPATLASLLPGDVSYVQATVCYTGAGFLKSITATSVADTR